MRSISDSQGSGGCSYCGMTASLIIITIGVALTIGLALCIHYRPTTMTAAEVAEQGSMHLWEVPHTQCALNVSAVPPCEPLPIQPESEQPEAARKRGRFAFTGPCSWNNALVTPPSDNDALGPWRCQTPREGSHAVRHFPNTTYRLSPDGSRIVVERRGLFMANAHITFRTSWNDAGASLRFNLAVNNQVKFLCAASQGPSRPGVFAYSSCSVSGLLSLQPGDAVWLMAPRSNSGDPVEVFSPQTATRFEILLISPIG